MHKGAKANFYPLLYLEIAPKIHAGSKQSRVLFVVFGTKLKIPNQTLRAIYLCMHLCALTWPMHLLLLTKIVFCKSRNLRLAFLYAFALQLPYFFFEGGFKILSSTQHLFVLSSQRATKKTQLLFLNASFLLSTYFIIL